MPFRLVPADEAEERTNALIADTEKVITVIRKLDSSLSCFAYLALRAFFIHLTLIVCVRDRCAPSVVAEYG